MPDMKRDTRAGKMFPTGGRAQEGEIIPADVGTQVVERDMRPKDVFFVSDEEKKEYGVTADEHLAWVTDPKYYDGLAAASVPSPRTAASRAGGRVVTNSDGEPVRNLDGVLVAVPMALKERADAEDRARMAQAERERQKDIAAAEEGKTLNPSDSVILGGLEKSRDALFDQGIWGAGSPSYQRDFASHARDLMKDDPEAVSQEETFYRTGGREYAQARFAGREPEPEPQPEPRRGRSSNRRYSLPGSPTR